MTHAWTTGQEQSILTQARETGRSKNALFYYAILRNWTRFHEIGRQPEFNHPEDALACSILSLSDHPEDPAPSLELLREHPDPSLLYALTKHYLRRNEIKPALHVAMIQLESDFSFSLPLNTVAKYMACIGNTAQAKETAQISLRVNKNQQDMTELAQTGIWSATHELYLDPVPRSVDISYYVPVHNGERYIRTTISGLIQQNYPLTEVIIVDDGSTDATYAIAQEYPVHIIRFEKNRGLAAGRNAGIEAISSPFIGSLDADVYADPGYTTAILDEYENASAQLCGVGGRLIETHIDTPPDSWRATHLPQGWYPKRMYFTTMPTAGPDGYAEEDQDSSIFFINGCNNIYRRSCLLTVGGYNEKFRTNSEDATTAFALRRAGFHLAFTRTAITYHHRRDTLESIINTCWRYGFCGREEQGMYETPITVLDYLLYSVAMSHSMINADLQAGNLQHLHIDFLLMFYCMAMDIKTGVQKGFYSQDQGSHIFHTLLSALEPLDKRTGKPIQKGVHACLDFVGFTFPAEPVTLPERLGFLLNLVKDELKRHFTHYPDQLCELLLEF